MLFLAYDGYGETLCYRQVGKLPYRGDLHPGCFFNSYANCSPLDCRGCSDRGRLKPAPLHGAQVRKTWMCGRCPNCRLFCSDWGIALTVVTLQ